MVGTEKDDKTLSKQGFFYGMLLLCGLAATLHAGELATLEQAYLQHGADTRQAAYAGQAAQGQLQQLQAMVGWQLYATVSPRWGREGEGANSSGVESTLGISHALLGSRERLQRDVAMAQLQLTQAELRARQSQLVGLQQLRLAYLDYTHATLQLALVQAFLSQQEKATPHLLARRQQGLMLPSDEQTYLAGISEARLRQAQAQAQRSQALQQLRQLTSLPLEEPLQLAAFRGQPASDEQQAILALPALQEPYQRWQQWQQQAQSRWDGINANVAVGLGQKQDSRGRLYGNNNLQANLSLNMPLSLDDYRSGSRQQRQAEADAALLAYEQARQQWQTSREQQQSALRLARLEQQNQGDYLRALQQALLERQLRAQRLPGDTLEQWLAARYRYYRQALAMLAGWQQEQAALVRLAAQGDGIAADAPLPQPLQQPLQQPVNLPESAQRAASEGQRTAVSWGSYVWDSRQALKDPRKVVAAWQRYGVQRVLLGLTAAQIASPHLTADMARLLDSAHQHGIAVELLLGDSSWIAPDGRAALQVLLQQLATLRMDGLSLDLEIEQLPNWQSRQAALQQQWLQTLAMAARTAAWPLAATFHHRHLAMPGLGRQLREAGVQRADIMLFSTSTHTVSLGVARATAALDGLPFSMVQSVEKILPAQESQYQSGTAGLRRMAQALQAAHCRMMFIQDWATLQTLLP